MMQEIAKHFDPEEQGYEVVEEAIYTMTGVAWYINDMKRKHEHAIRLQVANVEAYIAFYTFTPISYSHSLEHIKSFLTSCLITFAPFRLQIKLAADESLCANVSQEIQSLLLNWKGPDLTTYGELVLEGTFKVHRAKNERTLFLFDRLLLITKRRGEHFVYKAHISVRGSAHLCLC